MNIGFVGMLQVLFIGLKLGKVINWGWLWVLSPMWISLGLIILIVLLVIIGGVGYSLSKR